MGRASGQQHATSTGAFAEVFGSRRGSRRQDEPIGEPGPAPQLPFREVQRPHVRRVYDPSDALITACENCGTTSFLLRDWEADDIPALCMSCHDQLGTSAAQANLWECEDWCQAAPSHTGLCTP